mmetsp:Transcript_24488/g.31815  ORF Transcript_24488/g.31815 Transcript_24488/m.31815 type:complete len:661 (-) Transcript_24488:81-2063(-)
MKKGLDLDLDSSSSEDEVADEGVEEEKEGGVNPIPFVENLDADLEEASMSDNGNNHLTPLGAANEESSEEEDFEWEDGDEIDDAPPEQNYNEQEEHRGIKDVEINLGQVHEEEHPPSKKKRVIRRFSKQEYATALAVHKAHLLTLGCRAGMLNTWCSDEDLMAVALSMLPQKVTRQVKQGYIPLSGLKFFAQWFNRTFARKEQYSDEQGRSGSSPGKLKEVLQTNEGTSFELVQLFVSMCRSMGIVARYVMPLQHLPPKPKRRQKQVSTRNNTMDLTQDASSSALGNAVIPKKVESPWSEVLCLVQSKETECKNKEAKMKWIHVDPVLKVIDEPLSVDLGKSTYVIALDNDGEVKDVTRRYTDQWSKFYNRRLADSVESNSKRSWWFRVCKALRDATKDRLDDSSKRSGVVETSKSAEAVKRVIDAEEQEELDDITSKEAVPSSLQALKSHQIYCIEKHLKKYEVIYPRKPVGFVKGQVVFLRKHIHTAKSQMQWRREGLQVKEQERSNPVKTVDSKQSKTLELFGKWQTEDLNLDPAMNGFVPKTEHGNVEFWDYNPKCLPAGTTHLQYPKISLVAKKLGIDYAPALIGFQSGRNGSTPMVDGIVICSEYKDVLVESYQNWQQDQIEKQAQKRTKQNLKRWYTLVKSLLIKERLKKDYG